jgi:hypothetical protein
MADIRSALEEAMSQAEEGTLEAPVEKEIVEVEPDAIAEEKSRDEKGRFVAEDQEKPEVSASNEESEPTEEPEIEVKPELTRPSTWKKEYLPIWDKLTTGQQLTPDEALKLAQYSNQRESEYKKGVSTYKAEADNARQLREAIDPFVPELQKHGIHPAAWIQSLGRAHFTLATGTQEQKQQMFHRLAQDYGIQLNQEYGNQGYEQQYQQPSDPYTQQLMNQLQAMNQEVSTIKSRYEQEEQARLMGEISRVSSNVEKFPHFESVREQMAQLLERGLANDLESAYAKAVRLNDDVWAQEQERLLSSAAKQQNSAKQVAKAKSAAVSVRSVTPKGTASSGDTKDRRSLLAEQLGTALDSRV